jgi:hypothetical protein
MASGTTEITGVSDRYEVTEDAHIDELLTQRAQRPEERRSQQEADGEEEEYKAEDDDVHMRLQPGGEHLSLAEAEAAGDEGHDEGRHHDEEHGLVRRPPCLSTMSYTDITASRL